MTGRLGVIIRAGACAAALGALLEIDSGAPANASAGVLSATLTSWQLPAPVYRTVAVVSAGRIFVLGGHDSAGGTSTTIYGLDPRTGTSEVAGTLALATHGAAASVVDGRILVFGGASATVHNTVQAFNPASHTSSIIGYLPSVRADTTAATVGKETVLLGGFNGSAPLGDVWETTNGVTFAVVAHLLQPVRYPAVAVAGSSIYVFGGLISGGEYNGTFTNDIQRVDIRTGTARIVGHLPSPIAHAMGSEMGGHLYVIGGSTASGSSNKILSFDPANGVVSVAGILPQPITDAAVATIGRTTYVLGGISSVSNASVTIVRLIEK